MHWKDRIRNNPQPYTNPRNSDGVHIARKAAIAALVITLPAVSAVAGMWLGFTARKCEVKVAHMPQQLHIAGKEQRRTKRFYDRIEPDKRFKSTVKMTVKGNETIVERTK